MFNELFRYLNSLLLLFIQCFNWYFLLPYSGIHWNQNLFPYRHLYHTKNKTIYVCVYIVIKEGNPKAPFSIATTLKCRGKHYSFPWTAPLTLDLHLIMLRVKEGGIKLLFFEFLVWLNLDGNPSLLDYRWH